MKNFYVRALAALHTCVAPSRRGATTPRRYENQAAAAAIVSQAFKASAVYISAGPPPM